MLRLRACVGRGMLAFRMLALGMLAFRMLALGMLAFRMLALGGRPARGLVAGLLGAFRGAARIGEGSGQ
ncbi:MAG: hypothetical protein HY791_08190 [Deltaproteobacteria bacterium]|nr:hypothetical protein [Deltaproteobacteria bacterium]